MSIAPMKERHTNFSSVCLGPVYKLQFFISLSLRWYLTQVGIDKAITIYLPPQNICVPYSVQKVAERRDLCEIFPPQPECPLDGRPECPPDEE